MGECLTRLLFCLTCVKLASLRGFQFRSEAQCNNNQEDMMTNDNISAITDLDNERNDRLRFAKIKEAFEKLPNPWIKENEEKALSGQGPFTLSPNSARGADLLAYQLAYKVIGGVVRSGVPYVDNAGLGLICNVFLCKINGILSRWNMDCGPLYTIFENLECGSPSRSHGFSREASIR
jgi:hypothetical protein